MKLLGSFLGLAAAQDQWRPAYAEGHDGMVHLFEWSWKSIAEECENFLGPHKFASVQVSPPNENRRVAGQWWERYQPISYNLDTRSGGRADFIDMVDRCNAVGVRIIVDAIINHMCGEDALSGTGTGGCQYNTDTLEFPCVPFSSGDFNDYRCGSQNGLINNYGDPNEVRNCRLVGLTDLDHSKGSTADKIAAYMNDLIDIGVAGFRVDAAKHMWPEETDILYGKLHDLPTGKGFPANTRPWIGQEVIDQGGEPIKKEEYIGMGAVTEFNYCFSLGNLRGSLAQLKTVADKPSNWGFLSNKDAFVFTNNHDNQRGHGGGGGGIVTFKSPYDLPYVTGMMMALPFGTKRIMSSYLFEDGDQGPPAAQPSTADPTAQSCNNDWVCEHRWAGIRNIGMLGGAMRSEPDSYSNWWDNGSSQVSFSRGTGWFAVNSDAWAMEGGIQTGLAAGKYCDLAQSDLDSCDTFINVDATGMACVNIQAGQSVPMSYTIADARVGDFTGVNDDCGDLTEGPTSECLDCSCPDNKKIDCGHGAITENECYEKGCAWCPVAAAKGALGTPWCIVLAEDAKPPTPGPTDPTNPGTCPPSNSREDCGYMGIDQRGCEQKGCLWCPVRAADGSAEAGIPWCTYGASATTTTKPTTQTPSPHCPPDEEHRECGYSGITQESCEAIGCGWCPSQPGFAWCTYLSETTTTGGNTGTTPTASTTTTKTSGSTTTKPIGGTDECLPTQQCPATGNCNIPDLADRKDCGELASTPTSCVASGCCWEEQPPGPIDPEDPDGPWPAWCYYPL